MSLQFLDPRDYDLVDHRIIARRPLNSGAGSPPGQAKSIHRASDTIYVPEVVLGLWRLLDEV